MATLLHKKEVPLTEEQTKKNHRGLISLEDLEAQDDDGDIVQVGGKDVMDPADPTKKLTKKMQRYANLLTDVLVVSKVLAKAKQRNAEVFQKPKAPMNMAQMQQLMLINSAQMAKAITAMAGMYPCTQKRFLMFCKYVFDVLFA